MLRSVHLWLVTATLAMPGSCLAAHVQTVGYACTPEGCDGCDEGCVNNCNEYGNCGPCDGYGPCDAGRQRCTMRSTWRDNALNWTGRCGPIGRAARRGVPGARCLKYCMDTKAAPDSGWAPPARYPVNRTHTGFASYSSYGGGAYGGAPMVYQPTDTTQLGFSYAHVPTWRRNPAMVPPTPEPSAFHARCCPANARCGSCYGNCMSGGYGNCMGGTIINTKVIGGNYCPACVSQNEPAPQLPAPTAQEGVVRMNRPASPIKPAIRKQTTQSQSVQPKIRLTTQSVSRPALKPTPRPSQTSQSGFTPTPQKKTPARTAGRSRQGNRSKGGWFGLPSLSEVKF